MNTDKKVDNTDANRSARGWLEAFGSDLANRDIESAISLFHPQGYWRDLIAFSWNIKTVQGCREISDMLTSTLDHCSPSGWQLVGDALEADTPTQSRQIEFCFRFTTRYGSGYGHARLQDGRCWTLLTTLQSLTGHEERTGKNNNREDGTEFGAFRHRQSWLQKRQHETATLGYDTQPYCLIIGGGQAGIGLAARLTRLNVPTIVIERNPNAGDSWRNRYRSLCLHDPVWYDHMPYLPFPDHWPIYTPKDQLGDWLEMYSRIMQVNYWNSTECISANYDDSKEQWQVEVQRSGEQILLHPTHLILATGMSGFPNMPQLPGADTFLGDIVHSSAYRDGASYQGKKCIVIGSNNSDHDICADLWENMADVTMLQRSSSLVVKAQTLAKGTVRKLFSEEAVQSGLTTEMADLTLAANPYELMCRSHIAEYQRIQEKDKEFYDSLRQSGFELDFGEDGSGLYAKYLRYGAGYYIDVGASQLIIDGEVGLRANVQIQQIKPDSVILSDGSKLDADLIVCATGYTSMNDWAARIISPEVADRVGKCWGLGSGTYRDPGPWVGELRNMWKPTQQPNLWFHGGNLQQGRHYSLYLALQLKARMEGIPTPVYGLDEVHHLR